MNEEQQYRLLGGSQTSPDKKLHDLPVTHETSRKRKIVYYVITSLALAIIIGLLFTVSSQYRRLQALIPEPSSTQTWTDCGGSPAEAQARGCHFDWMMSYWYTPECWHEDLLAEAYAAHPYEWYSDPAAEHQVSTEFVARGEHHHMWTTEWFHREHCSYMWKKQIRYINEMKYMDSGCHDGAHTGHCARFVLEPDYSRAKNGTTLVVKYPKCYSLKEKWPVAEEK